MDLSKMKDDEKLYLCKWYFRAGFACLPAVWLINFTWFFEEAFRRPQYEQQKEIKKYVIYSALGSLVWAIALGTWIYYYQTRRTEWGEFGDMISFIIPTGVK